MSTIVRPALMPDELDQGYLGTIMRWNGFTTESSAMKAIASHFELKNERSEMPVVRALALVAGLSAEDFVQQHTLLPLRRSITNYEADLEHGSLSRHKILARYAVSNQPDGWRLCGSCVNEDLVFRGISYWRRSHQVPGQFWCGKHAESLQNAADDRAVSLPPSVALSSSVSLVEQVAEACRTNEFVGKFLDISNGLMEGRTPRHTRLVGGLLRSLASKRGLQTYGGTVRRPLLSDLVKSSCPADWLSLSFPELASTPRGSLDKDLDGALIYTSAPYFAYIFAAAALFETADDALNSINRMRGSEADEIGALLGEGSSKATGNDLRRRSAYGSGYADRFAETRDLVDARLTKSVASPESRTSSSGLRKAAVAFFVLGKSVADSADEGAVRVSDLEGLLRAAAPRLALYLSSEEQSQTLESSSLDLTDGT